MSSLDKALMKVLEHRNRPTTRRRIEKASPRELYVDEPSPTVKEPAHLRHQPESKNSDTMEDSESQSDVSSHLFLVGEDAQITLESFVIQTEIDPISPAAQANLAPAHGAESPDGVDVDPSPHRSPDDVECAPAAAAGSAAPAPGPDVPMPTEEVPAADFRQEPSAQLTPPFSAAWEVDAFQLPGPSMQMNERLGDALNEIQDHLYRITVVPRPLISIHSLKRGEGRTTLAIGLAASLARHGRNVLIVDADVNNPHLATSLGVAIEYGWETAIGRGHPVEECCIGSIADGFSILPLACHPNPMDREEFGLAFRHLLSEIAEKFDIIILDAGPESPMWGSTLDDLTAARIIVRDVRLTTDDQITRFKNSLSAGTDRCVETVDNFV